MNKSALAVCVTVLLAVCSPISTQAGKEKVPIGKEELSTEKRCTSAVIDYNELGHEENYVESQIAAGVTEIKPTGLVIGYLVGPSDPKDKMDIKVYKEMIEEKLAEIKEFYRRHCR